MSGWQMIFKSSSFADASIYEGMLEDNNIEVVSMNKMDSSYLTFGYIELYVHPDNAAQAKTLLDAAASGISATNDDEV